MRKAGAVQEHVRASLMGVGAREEGDGVAVEPSKMLS
jgi:hypothetical protein